MFKISEFQLECFSDNSYFLLFVEKGGCLEGAGWLIDLPLLLYSYLVKSRRPPEFWPF